uniref:WD repeat domain 88 n=1 Tax=Pipistrellus kuhlii TaxID=59472 RepID=A0A7J7V1Q9_PIPKU|nr:WD repeat domain 88 [Pipistrellus kuhlii]
MASQPPHPSWYLQYRFLGRKTYSSMYPDRRGKRAPRERPPVAPSDGASGRRRLSLGTLVKAIVVFKRLAADIRRGHILPCLNPLSTEQKAPEKRSVAIPEKTFWGDQEPLSKIPYQILTGHQNLVSSCHFCVNDTKVLSSSFDYTVKLWDAMEGTIIRDFDDGPETPVLACSVTADSRRIAAVAYDKTLRTWDLETGKLLWKIKHGGFLTSCNFSPDGKYVVSGLDVDHGICIIEARNAMAVSHIKDHHARSVTGCCFDPDSQKVASVSLDKSIKIWDVTSQATLLTINRAHTNAISSCCFTFSGHFLCTSSWDKSLKIWNIHTGEFRNHGACATLMHGHEGSVSSCQFARDSSFLVSGGFDKTVALWDVGEGYRKLSLKGHNDWVMDVAISNNKKWVLSASKDRTMRLWNIEEVDQIPLVIKCKKNLGLSVNQCEVCEKPFSTYDSDVFSKTVTKCVFCRMDASLSAEASSSSEKKDSLPKAGRLGNK